MDASVDSETWVLHPQPKERLYLHETERLEDRPVLVLRTEELKVLKEMGDGGASHSG